MPLREIRVSFWRRDWFRALLLLALVFIAYTQVFRAGFIWDDESHLTRNPCVIGPLGLKEIWTTTQAVYYPLVLTTFWELHKFVGLNPLSYHVLNVLLHAVSAILLWRVLRLLELRGAWLGAALWALHPGYGAIRGVGHGAEEHAVLRILSALDPVLFEMGGSRKGGL